MGQNDTNDTPVTKDLVDQWIEAWIDENLPNAIEKIIQEKMRVRDGLARIEYGDGLTTLVPVRRQ